MRIASVLRIGRDNPAALGYDASRDLGAGRPSERRFRPLRAGEQAELDRVETRRAVRRGR